MLWFLVPTSPFSKKRISFAKQAGQIYNITMEIYKFWSCEQATEKIEGRPWKLKIWRGSNEGPSQAAELATAALKELINKLQTGQPCGEYDYQNRPIREEIIQEFKDEQGALKAVITRNRYGALVLNAQELFFVDIDIPATTTWWKFLNLFSKQVSPKEKIQQDLDDYFKLHPEHSVRLYRTLCGFRLVFTNQTWLPGQESTRLIMHELRADPQYRTLCEKQDCFRARLTPKPWRIGLPRPHWFFPYHQEDRQDIANWVRSYEQESKNVGVCRHIKNYGSEEVLPELRELITTHDRYCLSNQNQLA